MAETAQGNVLLEIDGQVATGDVEPGGEAQCAHHGHARRAGRRRRKAGRRPHGPLRDPDRRRRAGILRRRRHQRLVGARAARHVAVLGQARPPGVRSVGEAAATGGCRRSTVMRWAADWNWRRWPISASPCLRRSSACPKSRSPLAPAGRAPSGWLASIGVSRLKYLALTARRMSAGRGAAHRVHP